MGKVEPYHFGHLPVWSEGNVYLGGARAWKKEAHCLKLSEEEPVRVELKEEDGKIFLDTNIYELIKDFKGRMIHTGILGKAFEPEQPFENPDGTSITFDTDYFGSHRGMDVVPGPFAGEKDACKALVR